MATRAQKIQLGAFAALALILFMGTAIVLTGSQFWQSRGEYLVRYEESVSGLEVGAPVKFRGVRVGSVTNIRINPQNVEQVEVYMQVDSLTPIKTDTEALIVTQGITGLKFIELMGGTATAAELPPGSQITAGRTMLDQLGDRAVDMSVQVEQIFANVLYMTRRENQERFDSILVQADAFMGQLNRFSEVLTGLTVVIEEMLTENREPVRELVVGLEQTNRQFRTMLASADETAQSIHTIVAAMELPRTMAEVRASNLLVQDKLKEIDLNRAIENISVALGTLQALLENMAQSISGNQDQLRATMFNLRMASESLKELSRSIEQRPSRLFFDEKAEDRRLP
jgi:phospholipid/cholesterol/gamma-HCH transport system substrate-binding protein